MTKIGKKLKEIEVVTEKLLDIHLRGKLSIVIYHFAE